MDTSSHKHYSIMLIDDDRFLLDMYAMKFKDGGCEVDAVPDPVAALEKLRKGAKPQIILVDVVMPTLSGFEFLETVKKENLAPNVVAIVLSNQGQQEDIDTAMKAGAAGYIIKASSIPSEVLEKTFAIADAKIK